MLNVWLLLKVLGFKFFKINVIVIVIVWYLFGG